MKYTTQDSYETLFKCFQSFEGRIGYFGKNNVKGFLQSIDIGSELPFRSDDGKGYESFSSVLNCETSEYRPFHSIQEFEKETGLKELNTPVTFKFKNTELVYKTVYLGYTCDNKNIEVILGISLYKFEDLYKNFEILIKGKWIPFGYKIEE